MRPMFQGSIVALVTPFRGGKVDEATIKAERARTKRTEESRRRRVARGLPPDRQPGEGPQGDNDDDSGDLMFDGADMEA